MNRELIFRLVLDFVMTFSVILAIAYQLTENMIHELVGIFTFFLFIIHNILNRRWYKKVLRKKHNARRIAGITVNMLLLAAVLVLAWSSIMISRTVFAFLEVDSGFSIRQIHTTAAYWLFVLMSVHLGMHWTMLMNIAKKMTPIKYKKQILGISGYLVLIAVVIYGVKASFDRNICSRLFMIYSFDFWDFDKSVSGFFINYMAIMGLYAFITHNALKLFQDQRKGVTKNR